jgi:hypothetical protein
MKNLLVIMLLLFFAVSASHAVAAGINDYDYYKPAWMGKERIIVVGYRGVPKKTVRALRKAYIKSYQALGTRPIADIYALFWDTQKSNLQKVGRRWCKVAGKEDNRCREAMSGDYRGFKDPDEAGGGFEDTMLGLNHGTEGWWKEMTADDGHLKTAAHEYFHVYQNMMAFYFEKEKRLGVPRKKGMNYLVGPAWMEEGGADYFAYNVVAKNKWGEHYHDLHTMKHVLVQARAEIKAGKKKGIKVTLKNYATGTQIDKLRTQGFEPHFQYDGGAWANAYLRYLTGTNKGVFTNYYKDIAELERTWRKKGKINYGWRKSFQKNFGMTVNQFYTKFNRFMKWSTARQMKILSAPLS